MKNTFNLHNRTILYIWISLNILGSVKIEIKPVNPFGETSSEAAQEKREEESLKDSSRWRESTREPAKPLTDPQIVRDFLMGDHCLYGGTGWWKYEFCYGMLLIRNV